MRERTLRGGASVRRLSPLSRAWAAAVLIAMLAGLFIVRFAEPGGGERLSDFSKAYYAAGDAVLHGGSAALWPLVASAEFVNMPVVAWLFAPFALAGPHAGRLAFSLLGMAAIVAAAVLTLRRCRPAARPAGFLLFALNGPLWYSLMVGNTTHFVLLLLIVAVLLWERGWLVGVGLLLGAAAVIKPMILLFGVCFVWRRNWRVAFGGAAVIGAALLSSVGVFGLAFTEGWYQHCVAAFAGHPMGAANNQSLDAFVLRLWTGAGLLRDWHAHALPPHARLFRDGLVGALLALTALALWRNRRPADGPAGLQAVDHVEFCLVLSLSIILSSVSWTHYYALLLLVFGLHFAGVLRPRVDRAGAACIAASVVLCSMPVRIPWFGSEWLSPLSSRTLESVWFLGGVLLLSALFRSALRRAPAGATANTHAWSASRGWIAAGLAGGHSTFD